jgi:hypothetical protein
MSIFVNPPQSEPAAEPLASRGIAAPGLLALRSWLAERRFATMDLSERRMAPLVYRNLKSLLTPAEAALLGPINLEYWASNQKIFHCFGKCSRGWMRGTNAIWF